MLALVISLFIIIIILAVTVRRFLIIVSTFIFLVADGEFSVCSLTVLIPALVNYLYPVF